MFIRFILVHHTDFYRSHPHFCQVGWLKIYPQEIRWLNRTYLVYEPICTTFCVAIPSQPPPSAQWFADCHPNLDISGNASETLTASTKQFFNFQQEKPFDG